MRIALVGVACLFAFDAASAQTVLKREPYYMSPGSVVLVDDGRCTTGKVMRISMDHRGMSRRKLCVAPAPQPAPTKAAAILQH